MKRNTIFFTDFFFRAFEVCRHFLPLVISEDDNGDDDDGWKEKKKQMSEETHTFKLMVTDC